MSNPSKQKGSVAETSVLKACRENGQPFAYRQAPSGNKDKGDIAIPGICVEVKDCVRLDLAGWLDQATLEAANADVPNGVVWFKKRGTTDPLKWYVLMDGATFLRLIK